MSAATNEGKFEPEKSPPPDWVKPHALVYYRPSVGGRAFAAVCDDEPRSGGMASGWTVRERRR